MNQKKRWISALAILPPVVWAILRGGLPFDIFIAIVTTITLWEAYRVIFNQSGISLWEPVLVVGFATALSMIFGAAVASAGPALFFISLNVIMCGIITVFRFQQGETILDLAFRQVFGLIYVAGPLTCAVLLRHGADGGAWLFFLLFVVFFGDIGAYYVGSFVGKHKLCPAVSPGKTIEGALGGLAAGLGIGIVFKTIFLPQLPWGMTLIMLVCLGLIAPMGDLFESVLKRVGDIKDSGVIMPGHGGLLDRIDAVLFGLPIAYLFQAYLM